MRRLAVVLAAMAFVGAALGQETSPDKYEKVLGRLVEAYNSGDYSLIRRDFAKIMLEAFPEERATYFFTSLSAQYGKIQKLDSPRIDPVNRAVTFPAHFERGLLDVKLVLDYQDRIVGLWFLPHAPDIPAAERNETALSLPFKERWLVLWGGDTRELNQHHDVPNQRFAFDFLGVDQAGNTHKGEGLKSEDYHAFGREVLAPADGVVTEAIDGVRDNVPGSMNPYSALGNAVFIQHREHEVSVLAHLKLGSVRVKAGDNVSKGQVVGLCGNSGNSSEPHLHYHLQNTPVIQDGTGIKCHFQKVAVTRDGKTESREGYSPIKGDVISPE